MSIKQIFVVLLALAAVGGGLPLYTEATSSNQHQKDVGRRFVHLTESEPAAFFNDVEDAVGACAEIADLPANVSDRVRSISSKIVAKIMHTRAIRTGDEDIRPAIRAWLKPQLEHEVDALSNAQFDMLVKAVGSIVGSSASINCIVSTSVSHYDRSRI